MDIDVTWHARIVAGCYLAFALAVALVTSVHTYGYLHVSPATYSSQEHNGSRHGWVALHADASPNAGVFIRLPIVGSCGTDLWNEGAIGFQPFCDNPD